MVPVPNNISMHTGCQNVTVTAAGCRMEVAFREGSSFVALFNHLSYRVNLWNFMTQKTRRYCETCDFGIEHEDNCLAEYAAV
jgi:hypothetical protein